MNLAKKETYTLSTPIKYQDIKSGMLSDCPFFELYAPTAKLLSYSIALKQGYFNVITSLSKIYSKEDVDKKISNLESKDKPNVIDSKGAVMMLYMSDIHLSKYIDSFLTMATMGILRLPNGEPPTLDLLKSLPLDDIEGLLGTYLANFIIGSLFQPQSKK